MERLHLHTINQLQLELADARERNSSYTDESHISQANSKDLSQFGQNNGNQVDSNGSGATNANTGVISNGTSDNVQSFASAGNAPTQVRLLAFLKCHCLDCAVIRNLIIITIYIVIIGVCLSSYGYVFHWKNMIQLYL